MLDWCEKCGKGGKSVTLKYREHPTEGRKGLCSDCCERLDDACRKAATDWWGKREEGER